MAEENDDEKTEDPSQYKMDEARKKGDVASSKELSSVLLLAGSLLTLILCGVFIYETFSEFIDWIFRQNFREVYNQEKFNEDLEKYLEGM